ncbi:MAG: ribbon-helix-helix domain-containing protein [Pseudomonadota bacterium]|nr:ribbon-helix-helix domain-containing protein [Pseudomonadota bacterium]MDP1903509.1 ribbon-helix-helix domain-containing protein [Pseudomonadota bacterium]MDP2351534.1 ribbon-helix-helix domain-containing protein [Pseudomonadota bacterium]
MAQAETKVLTAHIPLPLAEKVDQMAARLERSRGWIMKQALSAWIDQEEARSRLTSEALADVDAGRVIDHQAVQAWADSLGSDTPLPVPAPR